MGAALSVFLSGCAGYHLGPVNGQTAREKSVQVIPFSNQTLQPRLADAVTSQLRKELQKDATFQLATRDDGDILLGGVITDYHRYEQSFVPADVLTVQDYRIGLTAHITARERSTGKVVLDKAVNGYTIIRAGSDLASAERQAVPILAEDLARRVTALLAEGSW